MRLPRRNLTPRRHLVPVGPTGWLAGAVALCLSITTPTATQAASTAEASGADSGTFRFTAEAQAQLHQLWFTSLRAGQERVACLGGEHSGAVVSITHIEPIVARADSANASAWSSLRTCAPPEWLGTVHTHIARFNGRPYANFSAPDRLVMRIWRERWNAEGVFCLLYTDRDASCEAGYTLSARVSYGDGGSVGGGL